MGLNRSQGNMYDFITHTWNTVKGACSHNCSYCYMKRFSNRNPSRFDEKELKTLVNGKSNIVFVGSSCDLFAKDIPAEWINKTLAHIAKSDSGFLFQSKNPGRILDFVEFLPKRSVICTTIETNRWYPEVMNNSPKPAERADAMSSFIHHHKFVTIEPIMDFDMAEMVELIKRCNPRQVNIGADSGNNNLPEPSKEKLLTLIEELQKFTKIARKRNLSRLLN